MRNTLVFDAVANNITASINTGENVNTLYFLIYSRSGQSTSIYIQPEGAAEETLIATTTKPIELIRFPDAYIPNIKSDVFIRFSAGASTTFTIECKAPIAGGTMRVEKDELLTDSINLYYLKILTETEINEDVQEATKDIATIKNNVTNLQEDYTTISGDVTNLQEDYTTLDNTVTNLGDDVTNITNTVNDLSDDMDNIGTTIAEESQKGENIEAVWSGNPFFYVGFFESNFDELLATSSATTRECIRITGAAIEKVSQTLTNTVTDYTDANGVVLFWTDKDNKQFLTYTSPTITHKAEQGSYTDAQWEELFKVKVHTVSSETVTAIEITDGSQITSNRGSNVFNIITAREISAVSDMNGSGWENGDIGYILESI